MSNGGMPLRLVVPSLMRQSVTPVEFEQQHWPPLQQTILELLALEPCESTASVLSNVRKEELLRSVFKSTVYGFAERLLDLVLGLVHARCIEMASHLYSGGTDNPLQLAADFARLTAQFFNALAGVEGLFRHVDKEYTNKVRATTLRQLASECFVREVVCLPRGQLVLRDALAAATLTPTVPYLASALQHLYALDSSLSALCPTLFSHFIPGLTCDILVGWSDSEPRLKRKPEDAEWEGDTPPVAPVHTTGEGLTVQSHSEVHCDSAASVSFGNPSKMLKLDL